MRNFRLSWKEIEKALQETKSIHYNEEIKEITLVKPKEVLFHTERKGE